jgi:hypothetical protein
MLHSYFPIYQLALDLQDLRSTAEFWNRVSLSGLKQEVTEQHSRDYQVLLKSLHQKCLGHSLSHTAELAKRIIDRGVPLKTYADIMATLNHLNDSLSHELEKDAVVRIPSEQKGYFEQHELFGPKVAAAFPSCDRDIRKAGSCYALGQEDACVHHLMLALERGLSALAMKVGVSGHHANWQNIINEIEKKLKSLPHGPDLDFYRQVNAQFGFLKEAYRNYSAHAHDDPYDMPKALSILNHVRDFMQALERGGISE